MLRETRSTPGVAPVRVAPPARVASAVHADSKGLLVLLARRVLLVPLVLLARRARQVFWACTRLRIPGRSTPRATFGR